LFLDTRTKIVPLDEIRECLQNRAACWISGHFDPLLAEHIVRLAEAREPGRLLVVEVTNPAQPLLAQRARAELVAALSMVDFVVLGEKEAVGAAPMDAGIKERFIEHVLERHRLETRP
jgi:bifunctional ADP-heptose synthase (sugar kinase/adenylyltransferase)